MVDRPADLPDYESPPLVEVILSVQFAELQGYRTIHAGLLWEEKFRKAYPHVAEQPPLDPTFEVFGPQQSTLPFTIKQMPGPPVPRLWFMNDQQTELVQIQANRFIRNWRKVGAGDDYPRYEALRERFFSELEEVDAFFKSWGIGAIQPNQCEITYVNRLEFQGHDLRTRPGEALKLFPRQALQPTGKGTSLPEAEDCNLSVRYVLKDAHGNSRSRLIVTVQPWPREPALRLDLTVRGAPATADFKAVADFLDEGRRAIVHGFTAITAEQMHKKWGRVQ
jgi:uncharacterized protein (TIGR04255 family)